MLALGLLAAVGGCGGDARVELAAADSLEALGGAFQVAFAEYHGEVVAGDEARESSAVEAFVARARRDASAPEALDAHAAQFAAALAKLRADRNAEQERYLATRENLAALREVATGLRQSGLAGLQLEADTRALLDKMLTRNAPPSPR
jgi:hypothetical protein